MSSVPTPAAPPRCGRWRVPHPAGVLAACGGTTKKAASTTANKTLAKTLRFSNWTLYIDIDNKKNASVARAVQEEVRAHTSSTPRTSTTTPRTSGRSRAAVARPVDRPRHHRAHRQRPLSVADDQERLGREARQVRRFRTSKNLQRRAAHPNFDPNRDYSLPWQSGHDRHRLQRQAHGSDALDRRLARRIRS